MRYCIAYSPKRFSDHTPKYNLFIQENKFIKI